MKEKTAIAGFALGIVVTIAQADFFAGHRSRRRSRQPAARPVALMTSMRRP